jgi:hypothetical protein
VRKITQNPARKLKFRTLGAPKHREEFWCGFALLLDKRSIFRW